MYAVVLMTTAQCAHSRPKQQRPAPRPAAFLAIDEFLEQHRRDQHIPGIAFAIVRDDRVIYSKELGLRDLEHNLPVTPDTLFPIGSCTKAFTSMAVGLSQDRGSLSLTAHPREYLPYFQLADRETDAAVTLRDMLSHRTGLKAYADLAAEPGVLTREEYVRAATSAKPVAKLGEKFQYSNAMYSAAGEILGKANDSTWEQVIERDIFRPLGMRSSVTALRDATKKQDHATGYSYDGETVRAVPAPSSLDALAPGGAIASSTRDMSQWLRMLSGGGVIGGKRFISADAFRELITPRIPIHSTLSYALGWATYDLGSLRVIEHNGGSRGISALVSFIPERRVAFVLLANASPGWLTTIGNAAKVIWPLVLEEDLRPAAPVNLTQHLVPPSPATTALPDVATLLTAISRAAGDPQRIRDHRSAVLRLTKHYENQGIVADVTIEQQAPSRRNEVEVWRAAGREIGRVRVYFDGDHGGQETTFGQDHLNDADADENARREYVLHPFLGLEERYATIKTVGEETVGSEQTWSIELTPRQGAKTLLSVSKMTGRVLQRQSERTTERFDDFRDVDGEMVAFRRTIQDSLGESTILVDEIRFNVPIVDRAFAPMK
jgi:CubicO group peptidase (beta-lactamase class C family)